MDITIKQFIILNIIRIYSSIMKELIQILRNFSTDLRLWLPRPAGGRGASVAACADLTNQLQCCWVDPACAWMKH